MLGFFEKFITISTFQATPFAKVEIFRGAFEGGSLWILVIATCSVSVDARTFRKAGILKYLVCFFQPDKAVGRKKDGCS